MNLTTFLNNMIPKIRKGQNDSTVTISNKQVDITLYSYIKQLYLHHGATWDDKINIFGIRDTSNAKDDVFNDFIGIAFNSKVFLFEATTDPGLYYTKNPLNVNGAAHLCLGFYKNTYSLGMHNNQYEALIQDKGEVTVWRDTNKDFIDNDGVIDKGYFGINIHKGSDAKKIGRDSAGCQVIRKASDFNKFLKIVKESGKSRFSYMLFSRNEFPFWDLEDWK